jgi:hypothetical protein
MSIRKFSTASISAGTNKSTKLWDQETFQSGMFALATVSLTTATSSIVFSGIPADYTHLQIRGTIIGSATSWVRMQINSDTASNYSMHELRGNGSSATAAAALTADHMWLGLTTSSSYPTSFVTDLLDYRNTSKLKVARSLYAQDQNGAGQTGLTSAVWFKAGSGVTSDAITSLTFLINGGNFNANSQIALYGIKVA